MVRFHLWEHKQQTNLTPKSRKGKKTMILRKSLSDQDYNIVMALEERTYDVLADVLDETDYNEFDSNSVIVVNHKTGINHTRTDLFIEVSIDEMYDQTFLKVYTKDNDGNLIKIDSHWNYGISNAMDIIISCIVVNHIEDETADDINVHFISNSSFEFLKSR